MSQDQDRSQHLYDVATPLFARFGFRKTTVEEICHEAGISKRTFYEGFKDKGEFFGAPRLEHGREVSRGWHRDSEELGTARERIELMVERYIGSCVEVPVVRVIFESDESRAAVEEVFDVGNCKPLVQALVPTIAMGMESGEFRPMDPERVTIIIGTLLDSVFCILPELFKKFPLEPDELFVRELKDFIINGLLAHERI